MFSRPASTYSVEAAVLDLIMADTANPLLITAQRIRPESTVLDIGAGSGILPQILQRLNVMADIDGVDSSVDAADAATANYRAFYCQDAGKFIQDCPLERYDTITLNDVIEHMTDPLRFLSDLAAHLSPGTRIVLSTPNVAYAGVRAALWRGRFDYVDSGILERTHLRFFTLATLVDLFTCAGFDIEEELFLQRGLSDTEFAAGDVGLLQFLTLRAMPLAQTYQFLFVLTPRTGAQPGRIPRTERLGNFTSVPGYVADRGRRTAQGLRRVVRGGCGASRARTSK